MLVIGWRVGECSCGIGCGVVGDVGCEVSLLGLKGVIDVRCLMLWIGWRYLLVGFMVENLVDSGWRLCFELDVEEV